MISELKPCMSFDSLVELCRTTGKDLRWFLENGLGTKRACYRHDNQVIWVDFLGLNNSCLIVESKKVQVSPFWGWSEIKLWLNQARLCAAGQMRAAGGSVDSTGLWRKGGRKSMAIWQWLTKGLTTTPTTTTPPLNCTTQRYSYGPVQDYILHQESAYVGMFFM